MREGEAAGGEFFRIDQDLDLAFGAAADVDLGDARRAFEARADVVVDEVAHHGHVEAPRIALERRDAEMKKRIVGERTREEARFVDVFGVGGNLAERVVHADEGVVDVRAERKLEFDAGATGGGGGNDAPQVGDAAEVFLLFDENFLFDVLRGGAGPRCDHTDGADFEVGNHLHGHPQGGKHAEETDDQENDGE